MNEIDLVGRGFLAGLMIAVPIGPINVFCVRQTLAGGWKSGIRTGLGAAMIDILYGGIAAFSITTVIQALGQMQLRIRMVGGLLLLLMGISFFFKRPPRLDTATNDQEIHSGFAPALLMNLVNPAVVFSYMAVLAMLGLRDPMQWESTVFVICGIFCGSMGWWITLSILISRLRRRIPRSGIRCMNRIAGLGAGGFGIVLIILGCTRT